MTVTSPPRTPQELADRLPEVVCSTEAHAAVNGKRPPFWGQYECPTTWKAGGCGVLAMALQRWIGDEAELLTMVDRSGDPGHVVVKWKRHYIDIAGATRSQRALIKNWSWAKGPLEPFNRDDVAQSIDLVEKRVRALHKVIVKHFGDGPGGERVERLRSPRPPAAALAAAEANYTAARQAEEAAYNRAWSMFAEAVAAGDPATVEVIDKLGEQIPEPERLRTEGTTARQMQLRGAAHWLLETQDDDGTLQANRAREQAFSALQEARGAAGVDPGTGESRAARTQRQRAEAKAFRASLPEEGEYPDLLSDRPNGFGRPDETFGEHRAGPVLHTRGNVGKHGSTHHLRYMLDDEVVSGLTLSVGPRGAATIDRVYTEPAHRRQGYAAALLDYAKGAFRSVKHSKDLTGHGAAWMAAVERLPVGGTFTFKTVCPKCADAKKRIKTTATILEPGVVQLSPGKCYKCGLRKPAEIARNTSVRPAREERMPLRSVYPLQDPPDYAFTDYKRRGGLIVTMTPDRFLALARPLELDEVAEENITDLVTRMQGGHRIDPPMLEITGERVTDHDGRHRANAAKRLGITELPVLIFDTRGEAITPERVAGLRRERNRPWGESPSERLSTTTASDLSALDEFTVDESPAGTEWPALRYRVVRHAAAPNATWVAFILGTAAGVAALVRVAEPEHPRAPRMIAGRPGAAAYLQQIEITEQAEGEGTRLIERGLREVSGRSVYLFAVNEQWAVWYEHRGFERGPAGLGERVFMFRSSEPHSVRGKP